MADLTPAQGGIDKAAGNMSAQDTGTKALNLLDLIRQGDKTDFLAEWSKLSKAQKSAVEASMVRQENLYEANQRRAHAGSPNFKLDAIDLYNDKNGNLAEVDKKQTGVRQFSSHTPDAANAVVGQSDLAASATPIEQAPKKEPPKPVTFDGMTQAQVDAKGADLYKSLRAGTPDGNADFARDYDALTPAQRAVVGKAIQQQETADEKKNADDPNFRKLTLKAEPSGEIDSVKMDKAHELPHPPQQGKKLPFGIKVPGTGGHESTDNTTPIEYMSKSETTTEAEKLNNMLRSASVNSQAGQQFATEFNSYPEPMRKALFAQMQLSETTFDAGHKGGSVMRFEPDTKTGLIKSVHLWKPGQDPDVDKGTEVYNDSKFKNLLNHLPGR
jgi:hypothetical protein